MKFLMVYPNSTGNTKIPLGVGYLLTILKTHGHDVRLFDMTFYGVEIEKNDFQIRGRNLNFRPIDMTPYGVVYKKATFNDIANDLKDEINTFKPDLIGFTLTEDTSMVALQFADIAKKALPTAKIIMGGVYCMTRPEYVISKDFVDIICVGEGEVALPELIARIQDGRNITDVKGLWFKTHDGKIIKNEVAEPTNLDSIPFADLGLIDKRHFYSPMAGHVYKMTFIESQRGCPNRCTYCCNQLFLDSYRSHIKTYLRKKSIPRLIDELLYVKDIFGINFIQFTDDDFMLRSEEELKDFSIRYSKEVCLPFWIQAGGLHITDKKMYYVREAGCIAISMGIETGNEFVRQEVFKRRISPDKTIEAFNIMNKYGIRTSGNVIIGVPHEGRKEIFDTIRLAKQCKPKSFNVNIFAPYHGTALREYCVKHGYLDDSFIREGRLSWKPVLTMPQITQDEIENLSRTFVLYATLPEEYYPMIEKYEKDIQGSEEIFEELQKIYWEIAEKSGIDYHIPGYDDKELLKEL
ncbi:MAG: B12-binding domain-containing radical SAM protein [Nitrospirae bacterium]|nr:B12-binding domain-containing radical SAM protein [Nitrospirota bacterium]